LIPIVAVGDFKNAHIVTRLIAQLAKNAGLKPGYNSSEGIYLHDHMISPKNSIRFDHVQEVLFDPTIDFAVVQCGDSSLMNAGLGFNSCDIVIIADETNLEAKSILLSSINDKGYAILNADIDKVYELRSRIGCNVALFSDDINNERIREHVAKGGLAAINNKGEILINEGENIISIPELKNILNETDIKDDMVTKCILPSVLVGAIRNFHENAIVAGLVAFASGKSAKKTSVDQ